MRKEKFILFFLPAFIVLFIIFGVIIFPSQSLDAAKEGLSIWTNILIPSLLPFIIGANLIVDLKIVDIIGFIINPVTSLIFNVSGKGALVFVISTVSGYPVGAKLASELRDSSQISKYEAQRLVSFCSTSGPLFIIGSVATGMFGNVNLGYLMIICHYIGAIIIGLLFRNFGNDTIKKSHIPIKNNIKNVINNRYNNGHGFFVLFGNAVFNGVNTLIMIGGFVIVFSVIFKVLSLFNIISLVSYIIHIPLSIFGVTRELCDAFISGFFEMTIGCNKIASISNVSEILKASLASFLIGFSGLSILAQCCNFIAKTDINIGIYIVSKFLHGLFASLFTFILYPVFESTNLASNISGTYNYIYINTFLDYYIINYKTVILTLIIIYLFSALVHFEKISLNKYK